VALVMLLLACLAWVGIRGLMAKDDLQKAQALASSIQTQFAAGDTAAASKTATALAERVHSARDLTSDPIWRGAEVAPLVGSNLIALRQVSSILATVTDKAIIPVAHVVGTVNMAAFKPVNGAIDLKPLLDAQPAVSGAAATLNNALADARSISTADTIGQVADALTQLKTLLQKASTEADAANRAVQLLPAMLGSSTPRTYLVLFQNNAELRAGGGNPGALALLSVQNGRISLVKQASTSNFPHYAEPVLPLPVETAGLYGNITGEYMQDVTLTPQFPLSAALAREMWRRQFGTTVDGVLSIDPVALSYLLSATGPVTLPSGDQLTSANAVKLLLSDVYARYPIPAQQDAFFGAAAAAVFGRVAQGDFDPKAMIQALSKAGDEHRVRLWSAYPSEQASLAQTSLAGDLPVPVTAAGTYGIYLNDATGAKMDYYLQMKVAVGATACRKDGRPNSGVAVTLTNTAPADAATSLSGYVTGGGDFGVAPGSVQTNVAVYAPESAVFLGATRDGAPFPLQRTTDSGRPVAQFPVLLKPGESTTVQVEFLGAHASTRVPDVVATPTIGANTTSRLGIRCK
jgi:hypothetical protein